MQEVVKWTPFPYEVLWPNTLKAPDLRMIPKILCQKENCILLGSREKYNYYIHEFFYVASSYMFLFHKECSVCVFFPFFCFFFYNFVGEVGGLVIVHKRTFTPKFGYRSLTKVEKSLGICWKLGFV
jgi:hypothetical protein